MGVPESELAGSLLPLLRDGAFPSSDELLTTEVVPIGIPSVLGTLSDAKRQLSEEIRSLCREQGSEAEDWIVQAKRVQDEIAKCKIVAREIVREHEKVQSLEASAKDAQAKLTLLEGEIAFSEVVREELEAVASCNRSLDTIEASVKSGHLARAAGVLKNLRPGVFATRDARSRDVLEDRRLRLVHETHLKLEAALSERICFGRDDLSTWMRIVSATEAEPILQGLQEIGTSHKIITTMTSRIEDFILQPLLSKTGSSCTSAIVQDDCLTMLLGSNVPIANVVLQNSRRTLEYLHTHLPNMIKVPVAAHVVPTLVARVITEWLNPNVPCDLSDLGDLQSLQRETTGVAETLSSFEWPGHEDLLGWVEQAPMLWLNKRKMASLHAVKMALSSPRGATRVVERVEREMVSKDDAEGPVSSDRKAVHMGDDEDASGWDFDKEADEDNQPHPNQAHRNEDDDEDDAGLAWGWEDEDSVENSSSLQAPTTKRPVNGVNGSGAKKEMITLAETYTITDIPDYLLEIISKDILDAESVKQSKYSALHDAAPSDGLSRLSTFVLAMFRATAPTYYSTNLTSGNMHLYNDSVFVAQKLRDANVSKNLDSIEADCKVTEKFAKSAYAREMEIQRTIISDLLEGAQGFVSCTKAPYAAECEIAVTSILDRLRALHSEWGSILSSSALRQSIGSLLATVIAKMVQDIEDMEDISEPESRRLSSFCAQILTLQDIFMPPSEHSSADGDENVNATPIIVYVSNWVKLSYLKDLLDGGLEDIKWFWTEGSLPLDFSSEEVVDLIKALFAESSQRRNAISLIRQHRPGS